MISFETLFLLRNTKLNCDYFFFLRTRNDIPTRNRNSIKSQEYGSVRGFFKTNILLFIVGIGVSTPPPPSKTPPHSFLSSLPLNQQTVQAPPFRQSPQYIGFSRPPPLKSDLSVNPKNIKVFHR